MREECFEVLCSQYKNPSMIADRMDKGGYVSIWEVDTFDGEHYEIECLTRNIFDFDEPIFVTVINKDEGFVFIREKEA